MVPSLSPDLGNFEIGTTPVGIRPRLISPTAVSEELGSRPRVIWIKEGGDYPRVRSLTDATRPRYFVPIRLERESYCIASASYEHF